MEKIKLLFVSTYPLDSSSSASVRNTALLDGLVKNGVEVYSLTRTPDKKNSIQGVTEFYFSDNSNLVYNISKKFRPKNHLMLKLRIFLSNLYSKGQIYDNQRMLLNDLDKLVLEETNFDYIISSSDSKVAHKIVEQLLANNRLKARKWIQYWGDPFFADINGKKGLVKRKIFKEEDRLLNLANIILYTSPATVEEQKKLFSKYASKMLFIPTPFLDLREKETNNNIINVGYFGSYFSKDRNILPFYSAAKKLPNIQFTIMGPSNHDLKSRQNILIKKMAERNEAVKEEDKMDLLVCIGNKGESNQIPGKIFHYASTNKQVLVLYEKNAKDVYSYFNQYDKYIFLENNQESILSFFENYLPKQNSPLYEFKSDRVVKDLLNKIEKFG
ncbi:hypothetical protein [Vaginisenegalia massiliensis]|uniref:hypothetical protein n=1 Tax=Vaginisenegalia massiliensis TaxID=2058294 RepID=UPI000F528E53|nr:hypothetical protein [Vaginisenegalia massiliensis]